MEVNPWAIVFATLAGPILAVEAQRWVSKRTERKQRQQQLFRALMNTRIGTLTFEHVSALNAVPLEFHQDATIMQKWRTYLQHLNTKMESLEVWGVRRVDLYSDLLAEMAKRLGYGFDLLQLKNEIYSPQGHAEIEADQVVIRRGVAELLKGDRALPLDVRSIAQDPEMSGRIRDLQDLLARWLRGEISPKVTVEDANDPLR